MTTRLFLVLLGCLYLSSTPPLFPQSATSAPKRELRAVWIAAVDNIDFPLNRNDPPDKQRRDFIAMLDAHRANGFNAIIMQVRPSADALYAKSREPWSEWLTGAQGRAPEPMWDPLEFMIEETHKRGMEFHAWCNPFRSVHLSSRTISPNHISVTRPEWHLAFANPRFMLNPGLAEVREYVASVMMDIVRNYDIDGLHFDDYFYPYAGMRGEDSATFTRFPRGFTNVGDWRRDNVNLTIKMVFDSIRAVKPFVKFGVSPFGIWRNGVPQGIVGLDAFNVIFCDPLAWLQAGTVDYLMPQLYWGFGGGQDYARLLPWWLNEAQRGSVGASGARHLYAGLGAYRLASPTNWQAQVLLDQVALNRTQGAHGSVFFSSVQLTRDLNGIGTALRTGQFAAPALPPVMAWKDSVPPLAPTNVQRQTLLSGATTLSWMPPARARDGDTARFYAVYRFASGTVPDFNNTRALRTVTPARSYTDPDMDGGSQRWRYFVTALDRLWNESAPVEAVLITSVALSTPHSLLEDRIVSCLPNPASELVAVRFVLAAPEPVRLAVYDVLGREVTTLVDEILGAGTYEYTMQTASLPPGVYLCRMNTTRRTDTQRILVQR
jgi:uncharacterized lipoprotein YddW (UPF0748 family)